MIATVQEPAIPVVLRVWKADDSDVFALFPTLPADNYGYLCTSYQHVGQHSSADYYHCIANSRAANEAEATDLLVELRTIGYDLRPIKRATQAHHEQCRREAREPGAQP